MMHRRMLPMALATAVALVTMPYLTAARAGAQTGVPEFVESWTRQIAPGRAVSTSSPVVVANGGNPFLAAADSAGHVRAYDLDNGASVAGWGATSVGFGARAPLSSDGSNVYVPVAQDGVHRYPLYKKFNSRGATVWSSNPTTVLPSSGGFLLAGLSLGNVGGTLTGFGGSSGHWVYGVSTATGGQKWKHLNADSTMATPAVADLYGTGRPQVVMSTDTSAAFPGDRVGGLLRIFTASGQQICSASQFVNGMTYASSGYNNSSPIIANIAGRPLIVFGSTGPVQYGTGGNQVVAYNADCTLRWASRPLAAQASPSPTFADVRGIGRPDVVQLVGVKSGGITYPRVVTLDATTGRVLRDSGTTLMGYGAALAFPPSMSVATADVDRDGAQDLFVPAKQGRFLVLDGRTLGIMTTIPTNLVVQNTPVVTATGQGIRITMAGYNAYGAQVSSYVANGAALGTGGWHAFGNGPRLNGTFGSMPTTREHLLQGQVLAPGKRLERNGFTLTMQTDGNLVLRDRYGAARWSTGTRTARSWARLTDDGHLDVVTPSGAVAKRVGGTAAGVERMSLGADGVLRIRSGVPEGVRRLNTDRLLWSSVGGAPVK